MLVNYLDGFETWFVMLFSFVVLRFSEGEAAASSEEFDSDVLCGYVVQT